MRRRPTREGRVLGLRRLEVVKIFVVISGDHRLRQRRPSNEFESAGEVVDGAADRCRVSTVMEDAFAVVHDHLGAALSDHDGVDDHVPELERAAVLRGAEGQGRQQLTSDGFDTAAMLEPQNRRIGPSILAFNTRQAEPPDSGGVRRCRQAGSAGRRNQKSLTTTLSRDTREVLIGPGLVLNLVDTMEKVVPDSLVLDA